MKWAAGHRLGRQHLPALPGRGAHATVWQAHDQHLHRGLAPRRLHADAGLSPPRHRACADADTVDGQAGLVFALVQGSTLDERLRQHGTMAGGDAAVLMVGVVDPLRADHAGASCAGA